MQEIFEIIARINRDKGVSILLVEQNAALALKYAQYGYVVENGCTVLSGTSQELARNSDIQRFYLGVEVGAAA